MIEQRFTGESATLPPPAGPLVEAARVDRRAFAVTSFADAERADRAYWRSRTPDERLEALELCRQIAFGYDPTTDRISRFFEVAECPPH